MSSRQNGMMGIDQTIAMSVATRPLTCEELLNNPDDGNRCAVTWGELVASPAPTPTPTH